MTARRFVTALLVTSLIASGCAKTNSAGSQTRIVLADHSLDEFATYLLEYFPRSVTVHPGDSVKFAQTWTGEAHTVTMGSYVDDMMKIFAPIVERIRKEGFEKVEADIGGDEFFEANFPGDKLPWFFADSGESVAQNAAQPCFLNQGGPPLDADTPCAKEKQRQVPFNGRQTYYNSGFIPFEGTRGNQYTVPIAKDAKPGTYFYYCNLHGPTMSGKIEVASRRQPIPSQDEVNRQAGAQIEEIAVPLRKAFREAETGKLVPPPESGLLKPGQKYFKGRLAGLYSPDAEEGGINEFLPRRTKTKVGQKVSWTILGEHSISFDVPRYFPIAQVKPDGRVEYNPKIDAAAGGSTPLPEESEEEHSDEAAPDDGAPGEGAPQARKPTVIEGGTWDGDGFWSSGLIGGEPYAQYSMSFAKPGKYEYACLLHPRMVATVEVTR